MQTSSVKLYRDCLRLVKHIAGDSKKGVKLRAIVRGEFKKNAAIEDPAKIEGLKSNAIKALANYLMFESSQKDARFKKLSNEFYSNESKGLDRKDNNSNNSNNSSGIDNSNNSGTL